MNITVGADPEVFPKVNGEFVSGFGMVQGTKEDPQRVEKGAVQVDGMALEFNIDPAASEQEFLHNIDTVMSELKKLVPGVELSAEPVAHYSQELFDCVNYGKSCYMFAVTLNMIKEY